MVHTSTSQRLHEQLIKIISETEPGGRLLTEPALARQLGVSRATLREAMRTFEVQGLITRKQGSGTYVSHPSRVIESGLEVLESIETLAKRIGLSVSIGALKVEARVPSAEERIILQIAQNAQVTRVARVILAENRPVAYLIDVLPAEVLSPEELESDFSGSILDLLLHRGDLALQSSKTDICAVLADKEIARNMRIQRSDVLLCFVAELYSADGRVVDFSHSYFLPGYFRFHVIRKVG
jgi:GntR family transcriptional regulator